MPVPFRKMCFALLLLALAACQPGDLSTAARTPAGVVSGATGTLATTDLAGETPALAVTPAATQPPAALAATATRAVKLPEDFGKIATVPGPDDPEPVATIDAANWQSLPVLPQLSPRALAILRDGLAKGNNPRAFAKIGDCESQASWFLGDFDLSPQVYDLGGYQAELAPVIQYYAGSFSRTSLAARPGFTAASLLAPIWADRKQCEKNETPLDCEIRVQRPLVAFVMVGTNDASNPKTFEGHMRRALDAAIAQGVLPILGTKADNVEKDHRINATMARLAAEYQLPLWNYWAAVQPLPGHGLQEDGVHLTFAAPHFDDPEAMRRAWPVRNLNALQVLKMMMEATESARANPVGG